MNISNGSNANIGHIFDIMRNVVILSYYKGFPITSKAICQSIHGNTIVFKVSPPGSVCLISAKYAWVLGAELDEALKVTVSSFHLKSGILEVTNPTYAGINFGNRKVTRVEPREVIPVLITFTASGVKAQGNIIDISLGGAGILLEPQKEINVIPGENVSLTIQFPNLVSSDPVTISGRILHRSKSTDSDRSRFSVSFASSMIAKTPILSYIAHRRAELMEEIEQLYATELRRLTTTQ